MRSGRRGARTVITVAGESGVGKTTFAVALAAELGAHLLQLDDYFKLPPTENAQRRREEPSWVGLGEVRLSALEADIMKKTGFVVVEGTYVTLVESADLRIFIEGNPESTEAARRERAREEFDDSLLRTLAIEHRIIEPHRARADLVLPQFSLLSDDLGGGTPRHEAHASRLAGESIEILREVVGFVRSRDSA